MSKQGGVPPDTPSALQKQRQRRYHQRSRNGCITCKKRHVRCDETRPLCMNCLRTGGECGYTDPFVSFAGSSSEAGSSRGETVPTRRTVPEVVIKSETTTAASTPRDTGQLIARRKPPSHAVANPRSMIPDDQLGGLMLAGPLQKLPARSRWLFHTFAQRSIQDRPGVPGPKESFVVRKALANPGMLHVCLSLSAIQHLWASGSHTWEALKLPLQYHKAEAYRFIRQQIENPKKQNNDTTIMTIASLGLLEASLWEIKAGPAAGSIYNIITHIMGLRKVVDTYLKNENSPNSLFQRMILQATRTVQDGLIFTEEVAEQYQGDVYLPLVPSVLFMSLFPDPLNGWWNTELPQQAKAWFATDHSPGGKDYIEMTDVPTNEAHFEWFKVGSRNSYTTAFLYMCMLLREGALSSFILKLLIDELLNDSERTEGAFLEGRCDRSVWFWTMMMTLAAVASAPSEDRLEAQQLVTWQGAVTNKIRLANRVMGLDKWEEARRHLKMVAWEDGFDGEEEMRRMWEDIRWETAGTPFERQDHQQTVLVLLNNPVYRMQFRTGLPTPEDSVSQVSDPVEE
ncbi:hypothetical protein GE09DRAFT_1221147 [Coniochaeta sp. 2T2.1]|nr:hypothetical protein GE09DRAFT_1221147 [Coniochaeta sp. 2T2.1]